MSEVLSQRPQALPAIQGRKLSPEEVKRIEKAITEERRRTAGISDKPTSGMYNVSLSGEVAGPIVREHN